MGMVANLEMMRMMHPRRPTPVAPPGALLSNMGTMGVIAIFMLHMIYGAVVGAMYGPMLHGHATRAEARPLNV